MVKAKDTIINEIDLMFRTIDIEIMKEGGNDQMIEALRDLCELQAEKSFKAGMREVTGWIESVPTRNIDGVEQYICTLEQWKARLKGWGIE